MRSAHWPVMSVPKTWLICFLQYGSEVRHRRGCYDHPDLRMLCTGRAAIDYQMIFEVPSTFLIGSLRWGTCDRQTCSASIPNVHKSKSRRAESSACSSLVAGSRARKCFLGPRLMLCVFSLCCSSCHLTCTIYSMCRGKKCNFRTST